MTDIEKVARVGMALCQNALGGKQCPCAESGVFKCADEFPGQQAQAAIAAMQPAPNSKGSQMSDELNVWRDACDLSSYLPLPNASTPDTIAAAVIRDYGDKRYQQAIADVVEWLESDGVLITARAVARRFGKDA